MRVSIVIPAYNSERYLARTIESVLAQTETDWELVLVDDGSKDSTPEIIARYAASDPRIRGVRQENGGIAAARNRGFAQSNSAGEFVIFLDHDDSWEPEALATLLSGLSANPKSPAAYGLARCIDSDEKPCRDRQMEEWHLDRHAVMDGKLVAWPKDAPATFSQLIYENKIVTVGQIMFRRSALAQMDTVFDKRMVPCDDWELYLRLAMLGDIAFVHKVVLRWRAHDTNTSNDLGLMRGTDNYIRCFYATSETISEERRQIARDAYRLAAVAVARYRLTWARESFLRGDWVNAAKHLRHAMKDYRRSRWDVPAPSERQESQFAGGSEQQPPLALVNPEYPAGKREIINQHEVPASTASLLKIAVVIPAYNAHRFLAETIQSVIGQTWKDWELILVDDGSTDNTALIGAEWAERDQRIRVVAKSNAGVSVARNRGIAEISADTEYVAFLDADDLWEPDALESLAGALAANPRAVAAHGLHRRIDTGGELQRTDGEPPYEHTRHAIQDHRLVPLPISSPTTFEALVFKNYIMTGTILIRRRILQEIEHFDPKITHGEDWDLWLRLSMLGDIALVDRNILRYRQHGEGASSNRRNIYLGERQVRQKLMSAPGLAPAQRHLLYVGYRWSEWARSCSMLRWAGENVRQGNLPGAARQLRHAALGYIHYLKPG